MSHPKSQETTAGWGTVNPRSTLGEVLRNDGVTIWVSVHGFPGLEALKIHRMEKDGKSKVRSYMVDGFAKRSSSRNLVGWICSKFLKLFMHVIWGGNSRVMCFVKARALPPKSKPPTQKPVILVTPWRMVAVLGKLVVCVASGGGLCCSMSDPGGATELVWMV